MISLRTVAIALLGLNLALIASIASGQESRLGRLFYSPEERQQLNQKRGVAPTANSPAAQNTIVNGMVMRSGQPPIIFIDGKETRANPNQQPDSQGVRLKTESGQIIAAKPGQIIDLANGRAREAYQLVPGAADTAPGANAATPQPNQGREGRTLPPAK